MDKFLETYNFLRLNHEEIENRLITSKEIWHSNKKTKQNKTPNKQQPSTESFTGKLYQHLKKI